MQEQAEPVAAVRGVEVAGAGADAAGGAADEVRGAHPDAADGAHRQRQPAGPLAPVGRLVRGREPGAGARGGAVVRSPWSPGRRGPRRAREIAMASS